MPSLAPHIASVPPSGIRRVYELALELDNVIMLALGEPDQPVAPHILEAGARAWNDDLTNYTPNGGIMPLRQAIVEKLAAENGMAVDVEQVWVTVGGTQAIFAALSLVVQAGDEVLVPDPGYTTFTMGTRLLQADAVPYSLRLERGFAPDVEELDRLVTAKTRAIIVNSPSNPLGVVYDEEQLTELLEFARRRDLWIISDEVYERFTFGAQHVSIASLDDDDRVFSAFSLSKTYALTGGRVGYLVTPPGFTVIMRTTQETTIGCVNGPAQYAAIAAITGDQGQVTAAREHYWANVEAATSLLDERSIPYLSPSGAMYLWIDVSYASGGDVAGWAERFLLHEHVAVAPGSAFGRAGEGWIRVCVAAPKDVLLEGLGRLPAP